jgi:hypothetical protein
MLEHKCIVLSNENAIKHVSCDFQGKPKSCVAKNIFYGMDQERKVLWKPRYECLYSVFACKFTVAFVIIDFISV